MRACPDLPAIRYFSNDWPQPHQQFFENPLVCRRFVRMDILSGRRFVRTALDVLSGPTCLRRFVRTGLDILSRPKYLHTIQYIALLGHHLRATWAILGHYLNNTWVLLGHYLGNTWALLGNYLNNNLAILRDKLVTTWTLLGHYLINKRAILRTTWLLLGQYFDTSWIILGKNFGNTLILIGWYLGSTWALQGPKGSRGIPSTHRVQAGQQRHTSYLSVLVQHHIFAACKSTPKSA